MCKKNFVLESVSKSDFPPSSTDVLVAKYFASQTFTRVTIRTPVNGGRGAVVKTDDIGQGGGLKRHILV